MHLNKGTTLVGGAYTIEQQLGSGSFGITYKAKAKGQAQGELGSFEVEYDVCIKEFFMKDFNRRHADGTTVVGTDATMVDHYRRKFRSEAQNLSRMHHPGIVRVSNVFDENSTTYFVMEYLSGGSLDQYIRTRGHLAEAEATDIALQLCDAIGYMHANRMLHLDLKPGNVMQGKDQRWRLIDFGLSKQFADDGRPESSTSIGLGTPGYAPLEQSSYKADGTFPATIDIYALGATLYKMLTGQTPPDASSVLNEGLPLHLLQANGVSQQIIDIIDHAMEPRVSRRYPSTEALAAALKGLPVDEKTQVVAAEVIMDENVMTEHEAAEVAKAEASIVESEPELKIPTPPSQEPIEQPDLEHYSEKWTSNIPWVTVVSILVFVVALIKCCYY